MVKYINKTNNPFMHNRTAILVIVGFLCLAGLAIYNVAHFILKLPHFQSTTVSTSLITPSPEAEPSHPLLLLTVSGGYCAGTCDKWTYTITDKGTVLLDDKQTGTLRVEELNTLTQLINSADYSNFPTQSATPRKGTISGTIFEVVCPADSGSYAYTFYTNQGPKEFEWCEPAYATKRPLFQYLDKIGAFKVASQNDRQI